MRAREEEKNTQKSEDEKKEPAFHEGRNTALVKLLSAQGPVQVHQM